MKNYRKKGEALEDKKAEKLKLALDKHLKERKNERKKERKKRLEK